MAIFDELKSIGKVLQEVGKIEQYRQILDTLQKLLEMQRKMNDLEIENRELKTRLAQKKKLAHINEVYYEEDDSNRRKPFCAKCYDSEEKLIHMTEWEGSRKKCPNCKSTYIA